MSETPRTASAGTDTLSVAILGAGMSGLCAAWKLQEAGFSDYTIFEKSDGVGGTWRDNTYPGCGCDVPSHLYSYSFAPKADWSEKWSGQPEILKYFEDFAADNGILEHCCFGTEIADARYDDETAVWHLTDSDGAVHKANVLISGLGQLNQPSIPDFPGRDLFKGPQFHSARWEHSVDLEGKTICVIGNGPSAVQFVPKIVPVVEHMINFQRSPSWVRDRGNFAYTDKQKATFATSSWRHKLYREWIYWGAEIGFAFFKRNTRLGGMVRKRCLDHLEAQVADPDLRVRLTPDFAPGCKRILITDDYYPALARENVTVLRQGVTELTENGVVGEDGETRDCDVIIYATGFQSTDFLTPMTVTGLEGLSLQDAWKDGAEAHRGVAVTGFPNLFLLYGPNTNLGHNSIIFMVEQQVGYVVKCLQRLAGKEVKAMMPSESAQTSFNEDVQARAEQTVWATDCNSWYKNEAGKITNNWPSYTWKYRRQMKTPDFSEFELIDA